MNKHWITAAAVALTLLTAGCAGASTPATTPSSSSSPALTNPLTNPPTTAPTTALPSALPSASGPYQSSLTLSLTGVPEQGVEPNCWILDGYLLVGAPPELLDGSTVITVTGDVVEGVMTTCQQGKPLQVATAVTAAPTT